MAILLLGQACTRGTTRDFLDPNPGTPSPALVRLSVSPRPSQLMLGDSVALAAYGHLSNGDSAVAAVTWSSRIGEISGTGWYRATQEGSDTVVAISKVQSGLTDQVTLLSLNPLDQATVEVLPQAPDLPSGESVQFSSRVSLPGGSETTPEITWSATGGTIDSSGLFTANTDPGTYQVFAQVKGRTRRGYTPVTVLPATLDQLLLNPSSVSLLAGETRQFTAAASWSNGTTSLPPLNWSATGGTISASGLYTAGPTAGSYRVVITSGDRADTSAVSVSVPPPMLTGVILTPSAVTLVPGASRQFTVAGTWSDGSTTAPAVSYSATGGSITPGGLYTAGTISGVFRVIAAHQGGTKADTSIVTIPAPIVTLLQLVLSPASLALTPGAVQQMGISGSWSDGSSAAPAASYSATGGSITPGGLYTAGATPGSFQIIATHQGGTKADTSSVTITTPPATLSQLVLSPGSVTLATGAVQQFALAATWSDGSSSLPRVIYSATGGTISAGGLYTAGGAPGAFRVIATHQGGTRADTSSVTISVPPPTLSQLVLSPATSTLAPGASQQFTVSGLWSDGSSTTPGATYSATGGTITAGGLYTAGVTPGAFRVIATHQGGIKADTSTVSILVPPPTLTQLVLNPGTATLTPGATRQFVVAGSWSDGSSTVPLVNYSATGGSITAAGLYTAGPTLGAFRVIAIHQGGTKADTSTVTISAPPPVLTQLVLSPAAVTLVVGATQQFLVTGTWSDGSSTAPVATYAATGGTISAGGLYTAGSTPGAFRVIATHQGGTKADTSAITVTPPPATGLALVTQPGGAVSGLPFTQQPVVELRNAQNQPVLQTGIMVTVAKATGTGALGGTLSAATNSQGRATFAGLQVTGSGPHTLVFTAVGLTSVTSGTLTLSAATLRALASARGFQIGAAVRDSAFSNDAQYKTTLLTQYNSIVPEDATDFWPIHPGPTQYNFAAADALVNFAQANGMAFHGHHLAWHAWIPTWVTTGAYTDAQLRNVLKDHITTVVGRYRGKATSWDVANEVIDDQACFANNCGLQPSFWLTHLGPEYIDSAFVWAHRADPAAKLYLNDYRTETINNKSDAVLALAQGLKARGVPIDGVGFQVHILQQFFPLPTSAQVQANFQRFANAGFNIRITEMDVDIPDAGGAAALAGQASVYSDILDACLKVSRCIELTTWGFSDRFNWIPFSFPGYGRALPFDTNYQPKPAFTALLTRLGLP